MFESLKKVFWKKRLRGIVSHFRETGRKHPSFLFFANEAEIQPFYKTLLKIGKTVSDLGGACRFLGCLAHLPFCGVHLMHDQFRFKRNSRDRDCYRCMRNVFRQHPREFELVPPGGSEVPLPPESRERIRMLSLLNTLKVRAEIPGGEENYQKTPEFVPQEKAGIAAYQQTKEAIRKNPNSVFVHMNNYALSLSARSAVAEAGIRSLCLVHAGLKNNSPENIVVNQEFDCLELRRPAGKWGRFRTTPLPDRFIQLLYEDLLVRLEAKGSHTWSPEKRPGVHHLPESLREDYLSGRPVFVAFTSSMDEMRFEEIIRESFRLGDLPIKSLFPTQESWLCHLAEWSCEKGARLWIRIHPRTKILGRPCETARTAGKLAEILPGVRCIQADDPVSSYDLILHADLAIYGWSSMGLEAACLGLPALSYQTGACHYPPEAVGPRVTNLKKYEEFLLQATKRAGFSNIIDAWRANALVNLGNAIHDHPDYLRKLSNRKIMKAVFLGGDSPLKFYAEELKFKKNSAEREKAEIRKRLAGILEYMLEGKRHPTGVELPSRRARPGRASPINPEEAAMPDCKGVKRIQMILEKMSSAAASGPQKKSQPLIPK